MKSDYVVRARKFYNSIAMDIAGFKREMQFITYFRDFNITHHRHVVVMSGSTRIALITSDYVIKIDYNINTSWGNSTTEQLLYDAAVHEGVADAFCPITQIAANAWVMPRCITDEDEWDGSELFIDCTEEEQDFIENYVQDIHGGNIGILHGRYVLIDYAAHTY